MAEPRSLYQAAAEGNLERVRELLNCGGPVDQRNLLRESLEQSGTESGEERRDGRLLWRRLTTEETDQNGWTPLHVAAYCGNVEIVRMLLGRGADINEKYPGGNNVLHPAACGGNVGAFRLVVDQGKEMNEANESGHTYSFAFCSIPREGVSCMKN